MQNKKIFEALIEDASYSDLIEMHKATLQKLVEKDSEVECYHSSIRNKYPGFDILGNYTEKLLKSEKAIMSEAEIQLINDDFEREIGIKNMSVFPLSNKDESTLRIMHNEKIDLIRSKNNRQCQHHV